MHWIKQHIPAPLGAYDVHLWRISLDVATDVQSQYFTLLSEDERERANRFYRTCDQMHYTVTRGVLRTLLGHYLQCPPKTLQFDYNPQGKPGLSRHLKFNVSHSHGQALLAFSQGLELGVDLEMEERKIEWSSLAQRFFAEPEFRAISTEPTEEKQKVAFFRCWTRKEAYVKAHGDGLMRNLQHFTVTVGEQAQLLDDTDHPNAVEDWLMYGIDLQDLPFQAAIVIANPHSPINWVHYLYS